jgi:hypothetical protein
MKARRMRRAGHVAHVKDKKYYFYVYGNLEWKI